MKKIKLSTLTLGLAAFFALSFSACDSKKQDNTETPTEEITSETPPPRESPKMTSTGKIGEADITITYGSPAVKGREIWGKLVPYNEVWRTGANEATTFETSRDITINGQALPAGKYALFTIPTEENWTVIFNKTWDQWGAYEYDETKDQLRVVTNVTKTPELHERMNFSVVDDGHIILVWEMLELALEVK